MSAVMKELLKKELTSAQRSIFDIHIDPRIINLVINWQLSKRRSGNHAVKDMSTVHGTNRKPFAQKGGGRARQGSRKAPHMRGGAVSMGPVTRSHEYKVNKKTRLLGLKMIIADKIKNDAFILVERLPETYKTKESLAMIQKIHCDQKALFIVNDSHKDFIKSVSNVPMCNTLHSNGLNVYSIIKHTNLVLDMSSLEDLIKRCGGNQNDS